jgi:hypothetical protein
MRTKRFPDGSFLLLTIMLSEKAPLTLIALYWKIRMGSRRRPIRSWLGSGRMKAKRTEIHVRHEREKRPVRIVADAAVTTRGPHGGRLLLVLLLDTTDRPDIAEFIRVHESFGPGDVRVQWGKIEAEGHEGTVALFLTFIRPMELFVVLEFNIARQGLMVEQILTGRGIYLARAEGDDDRLIRNIDRPKVIVEVPDTGFRKAWDETFHKHLARHYRNNGLSRSESRQAARSLIEEWRKFGSLKMRDIHE